MIDRTYCLHLTLLVILAIIWGSAFTSIKIGIDSIPPLTLVAVRLIIAVTVLYGILLVRGKKLLYLGKDWITLFILGFTGSTCPFFLISWGETGINSSTAGILMAVMPLVTIVAAHFFTNDERITTTKILGVVIGFGGVVLLVGREAGDVFGSKLVYELAVSGAAIFYGISAVITRRLPKSGDPVERGVAVTLCSFIQILPISLIIDKPWLLAPSTPSLWAAIYLGLFPTAVGALIYFYIIQKRGTTFFASINYMIPCVGVVMGVILLEEEIEMRSIVALCIILSGILITNRVGGLR